MLFALSFLIVAFGQPAWLVGLGPLAAAFGYALFWRSMLMLSSRTKRFVSALIWFTFVQAVQLSWMATTDYMGPFILVVYSFLILAMGVQFALVSLAVTPSMTLRQIGFVGGAWVFMEWMRLFFLCGFTWNPVGLSLTGFSLSLQFASVGGIFFLSFWVIIVNMLALKALLQKSQKHFFIFASFALFPYVFGVVHEWVIKKNYPVAHTLDVGLIQTGLFPEQKEFLLEAPESYIPPTLQWRRILRAMDLQKKVDLLVFPEAALPLGAHIFAYRLEDVKKLVNEQFSPPLKRPWALFDKGQWKVSNAFILQTLANRYQMEIIVGLDDQDALGKYNAAFHFVPNAKTMTRYEKQVLVPIGEYVPLQKWKVFSNFVAKQFGIYSSFDRGVEPKVFKGRVPIGISICLEETFSELNRDLRNQGAQLLVNLTNDVWFPSSKLPLQHFFHGKVRSVETGSCMLRSCNTGLTAAVDCFGREIASLPLSESRADVLYAKIALRNYPTFYLLVGNWGILSLSFLFLLLPLLRKTKKSEEKVAVNNLVR